MEQSNLARIFKALGNEQRLALFTMIHRMGTEGAPPPKGAAPEPCCAVKGAFTAACRCMGLARSTISHHFAELQRAGLITCTREGQGYLCQVNPEALQAVRAFLK